MREEETGWLLMLLCCLLTQPVAIRAQAASKAFLSLALLEAATGRPGGPGERP